MKYGLWYYKNTHNLGDDIWAYAQSLFYPHIDYLINNTDVYKFKSENSEDVAAIVAAFVEPYNFEYSFISPTNVIPLFVSSYFRPTLWEFLQNDLVKAYLKAYEPIGCRTREQADSFCQMGIDAYFSGCISLTLPYLNKQKGNYICCVDVPDDIVALIKQRVGGKLEVKIMSHEIQDVSHHSNLSINERFEIVKSYIEVYAGAHCVITSRLHTALPCLTQKTPVLLATTRESKVGVNDIQSRLTDFLPLVHHHYYDDFKQNTVDYDFMNPPENPEGYLTFRENIMNKCTDFIQRCESGEIINQCPFTEQERAEALIDILQHKVVQLKAVVDGKNVILEKRNEHITKVQRKLLECEHFNVWEGIEYFGDWKWRSKAMRKYISPDCRSILDLGCGEMHIKQFLNPNMKYYGCDYKKRDEDTIVCDLAMGEFPEINVDAIFIAGVLEYLYNWKDVLKKSSEQCRQIVMSYSTKESAPDRDPIWVTHISESEIIEHLAELGFALHGSEVFNTSKIFNFIKA